MDVAQPPKSVYAILNAHSGWSDSSRYADQLTGSMQAAGIPITIVRATRGMNIAAAVKTACAEGCTTVIAGGGDGTLNAVAAGLQNSGVPMAILPVGTLNHLARDLSVPLNIQHAIDAIHNCAARVIDLGEVNGHIFLNNSIIGLYPAYRFARERRERSFKMKWLAIASAMLNVFRRNPSFNVRFLMDGQAVTRRTPYILVANNEHKMEGYQLGNRARLDSGLLWIYVMRPLSRWGLVRLALSIVTGRFHKHDDFEVFAAQSVHVETRKKRIGVAIDGEVIRLKTPLAYRSLPAALQVLCPR